MGSSDSTIERYRTGIDMESSFDRKNSRKELLETFCDLLLYKNWAFDPHSWSKGRLFQDCV